MKVPDSYGVELGGGYWRVIGSASEWKKSELIKAFVVVDDGMTGIVSSNVASARLYKWLYQATVPALPGSTSHTKTVFQLDSVCEETGEYDQTIKRMNADPGKYRG